MLDIQEQVEALGSLPEEPITAALRKELISAWGGVCYCCNICAATEVDHIIARARNGPDRLENYVPFCGPCNRKKSARYMGHCWTLLALNKARKMAPKIRRKMERRVTKAAKPLWKDPRSSLVSSHALFLMFKTLGSRFCFPPLPLFEEKESMDIFILAGKVFEDEIWKYAKDLSYGELKQAHYRETTDYYARNGYERVSTNFSFHSVEHPFHLMSRGQGVMNISLPESHFPHLYEDDGAGGLVRPFLKVERQERRGDYNMSRANLVGGTWQLECYSIDMEPIMMTCHLPWSDYLRPNQYSTMDRHLKLWSCIDTKAELSRLYADMLDRYS